MDLHLSDEQAAIVDLSSRIIGDHSTHVRLRTLERSGGHLDDALWGDLASSGLLAVSLPAECGGAGLGFLETYLILIEVGRRTARVPVLATVVLGALPIAEFGSAALRADLLPKVVAGEQILTAALVEAVGDLHQPAARAHRTDEGWVLNGDMTCVPAGMLADLVIVPANVGSGDIGMFVVDALSPGFSRAPQQPTNDIAEAQLSLVDVRVPNDRILGDVAGGTQILDWMTQRATAALCAVMTGACEEALRLTAEYTTSRHQFERPIATFQAVGQRAADAYIDTDAIRLAGLHAAWRLSTGRAAAREVAIAKFWAADGGQRVVHAAQHLHGGIGLDVDYPVHRYFLWAKHVELTLGGATHQLRSIGAALAAEEV